MRWSTFIGSLRDLLDPDQNIKRIEISKDVLVVAKDRKYGFYQLKLEGDLSVVAKPAVNLRPKNDLMGIAAKYSRQPDPYYVMLKDRTVDKVSIQIFGRIEPFLPTAPYSDRNDLTGFAKPVLIV